MKHLKRLACLGLSVPLVASLINAPPAHAAHAVRVRVTLTSVWSTPSPDPMGITYDPRSGRLFICDSEVDEMPALWRGSNFFIARRKGTLFARRTFKKFTVEPEDLALNSRARVLYVTDDDLDRVFRDKPGKDGLFGTRDDVAVTILRTHRFGSFDPEGLTWFPRKKMLIVSDSTSRRIYKIRQGKDHRFGTRDDVIGSFGTHRYGFTTAEDVVVTRFTHHLLIVSSRQRFILETTLKGALIRKIDLTGLGIKAASGITFAPGTDGSPSRLYVTDSGVDNNVNPAETMVACSNSRSSPEGGDGKGDRSSTCKRKGGRCHGCADEDEPTGLLRLGAAGARVRHGEPRASPTRLRGRAGDRPGR